MNTITILALGCLLLLGACAQAPSIPQTPPPPIGGDYPEKLDIPAPGQQEVVVVVNDNIKMVHAGMFAADKLLDPAGSYLGARGLEQGWPGTSLQDYVRFQLEDGPVVKLYRFTLPVEAFARIRARVDEAGVTMPFFCAAKVQNILSGVTPFEAVPDAWVVSPATLAYHLDKLVGASVPSGACYWPNGASCNPRAVPTLETASK